MSQNVFKHCFVIAGLCEKRDVLYEQAKRLSASFIWLSRLARFIE